MKKHADSSATACFCFIVKAFGFNLTQKLHNKPRAAEAARDCLLSLIFYFSKISATPARPAP